MMEIFGYLVILLLSVGLVFIGYEIGVRKTRKKLDEQHKRLKRDLAYCEGFERRLTAYGNTNSSMLLMDVDNAIAFPTEDQQDNVMVQINGMHVKLSIKSLRETRNRWHEDRQRTAVEAEKKYGDELVNAFILGSSKADSYICNIHNNPDVFSYIRFGTLPKNSM